MFKFDVYFQNIEVINYFWFEKDHKLCCWHSIIHTSFNTKIIKKKSFNWLCRKVLDAVYTHVTSSAASRDSVVKLTTDSYQFKFEH